MSFTLNFQEIEEKLRCLHVLVCCCVANQYTKVTSIFFDFSYQRAVNKSNNTGENIFK